jgi:2-dehydropantoate 2-reductase
LIEDDGSELVVRTAATDRIDEAGPQDLIILGMKAHQVAAVVPELAAMYHRDTMVLTAQNGIPWWYFMKHGGPYEGTRIESVDPGGVIASHLDIDRVIASVVYPAAEISEPGVIRRVEGTRFSIAELDNTDTPRVQRVAAAFRDAGLKAPVSNDVRAEIWTKMWGNLSLNPISALTHATLVDICQFPLTRTLLMQMMREAQEVAESLGVRFKVTLERRIAGAEAVGAHKTSMLQDVEAGRQLEVAALMSSVVEIARIVGKATPHIDAIHAATCLLARTLEQQQGALKMQPR